MKKLNKEQYLKTMGTAMHPFSLKQQLHIDNILEIARDILIDSTIHLQKLALEHCCENDTKTYSHFVVNWGVEDLFLIIISDDIKQNWYGFYFLNLKDKYGIGEMPKRQSNIFYLLRD